MLTAITQTALRRTAPSCVCPTMTPTILCKPGCPDHAERIESVRKAVFAYLGYAAYTLSVDQEEPCSRFVRCLRPTRPIYRVTRQFVRTSPKTCDRDLKLILKFAADTDEALFLFDDALANYLETHFKKALRLHTVGLLRDRMQTNVEDVENFAALVQEESDLAVWFAEQPEKIRIRFAPFLRLV